MTTQLSKLKVAALDGSDAWDWSSLPILGADPPNSHQSTVGDDSSIVPAASAGVLPGGAFSAPIPPISNDGFSAEAASALSSPVLTKSFAGPAETQSVSAMAGTDTAAGAGSAAGSGLVLNITYDPSVNSAPPGFVLAVNAVAQIFQSIFFDNVTINITVAYGAIGGLGASSYPLLSISYAQIKNALAADSKSADDATAVASLPNADPIGGTHSYFISLAEAKALGLLGATGTSDGTVTFSNTANIFDYDNSDGVTAGQFDFSAAVAHEFSEVMGRSMLTGTSNNAQHGPANGYTPLDLFHFAAPGVRTFVGTQAGYFSADGGNTNLNNFNTNINGDWGDWAASAGNDSFRAFSNSGVVNAVTQTDIREMDVLGWDQVTALPDLTASGLALSGTTVSYRINNVGAGPAAASTTGIYLSTDSMIDSSDLLIAAKSTPPLAVGGSDNESVLVPFPGNLVAGTYYVGTIANYDGQINESDQTDNASNGMPVILGNDSDNTLIGSSGDDTILGLGGNDTLIGLGGNNVLDGGPGVNTADYSGAPGPVSINFSTRSASNGYGGTDTLLNIQVFEGGSFNDVFVGGPGNHVIDGGLGSDTLDYSVAATGVSFYFSTGLAYNNFSGPAVGVDQFSNIEVFRGGSGNDVFVGGPGNHGIDGSAGNNILDYSAATTPVQFDLSTGFAYNNFGGSTVGVDDFSNIQAFEGGSHNDVFVGGPGNHVIDGGPGSDTLDYSAAATSVSFYFSTRMAYNNFGGPTVGVDQFSNIEAFKGGSGNDVFVGGPGNHGVDGGPGLDTLDYSAATTGVSFYFSTGLAYNNFGGPTVGVDQFSNIEVFKGGSGNDVFYGGPGNHGIDGGAGINGLDYSMATSGVQFNLATGCAYNNFGGPTVSVDRFFNIEVFSGGSGNNDFIAGNAPGTYLFVAGSSGNTFSFSGIFGNGTITNFVSGLDGIYLDHNEFADFAAVQSHAQQIGADTVISYDANDSISLHNVALANLHASDFHFV